MVPRMRAAVGLTARSEDSNADLSSEYAIPAMANAARNTSGLIFMGRLIRKSFLVDGE
jgi:hypothetical protein